MAGPWSLDDIRWDAFRADRVDAEILKIVKAAALVEFNGEDYGRYLCGVFAEDALMTRAARHWAVEEVQHGEALARWARLADPSWDFERAVARFRAGFRVDVDAAASIRGTRAGELVARCMVETGTNSYYTALAEAAEEPVLKEICARIAADELRHYNMFFLHMKRFLERDGISAWARLKIGISRVSESEDDELAYAYFAANAPDDATYDRKTYSDAYLGRAARFYRRADMDRATDMVLKACGLSAEGWLARAARPVARYLFQRQQRKYRALAA
jgi:hypothetical protein